MSAVGVTGATGVVEVDEEGQAEIDREATRIAEEVNRPAVYLDPEDGSPVYRASAVYACQNILLAARHGVEGMAPPPWMQQRYDAGHDHEPLILRKLDERFSFRCYGAQVGVEWPVGAVKIRGHVDALNATDSVYVTHLDGQPINDDLFGLVVVDGVGVIDAKALSQGSYDSWCRGGWKAFPYYAWQQTVYMKGLDAGYLIMAVKNKNTDDLRVEMFTAPPAPSGAIVKKVLDVERLYREGPGALFRDECSPATFPCPYFTFHPKKDAADLGNDEMARVALRELSAQRLAAAIRESEAGAEKKALDLQIAAVVGDRVISEKLEEFTTTTYHSSYSGPDWDAVAAAVGITADEAKARFTVSKESTKLSVKVTPRAPKRTK